MDQCSEVVVESWDRQCQILMNLVDLVTDDLLKAKPDENGWTIGFHFCHIHETRYYWLSHVSPEHAKLIGDLFTIDGAPIYDLSKIKEQLGVSAKAVRDGLEQALREGKQEIGPYSHPIIFIQHMIWHEGYHFSLIRLAMRLAGAEPSEEWEDANVWGLFRAYG